MPFCYPRPTSSSPPTSSITRRWPYIQRCGLICVFPDVLFSYIPDRNLLSVAVRDRYTKNLLTQEDSFGVVAKGAMTKVYKERFGFIKPVVNWEIVVGLAAELLDTILRML